MFCPKCGKDFLESDNVINGFHIGCYLKDHKIIVLPELFEVQSCNSCGKVKLQGRWNPYSEPALAKLIQSKADVYLDNPIFEISFFKLKDHLYSAKVKISGLLDGKQAAFESFTEVKFTGALCDACMKKGSNYWESLLQIRFDEKPSKEELEHRAIQVRDLVAKLAKTDSMSFIMEEKIDKNGMDFFIGGNRAGRHIAKALEPQAKGKIKSSYKFHGMDEHGIPGKRYSYCLRF